MKNKNVGWLIVGISLVIFLIIAIFNFGMKEIVSSTCSHGPECTMYDALSVQTWISAVIALLVFMIGIFLIFSKENEKIVIKKIKQGLPLNFRKFDQKSLERLDPEKRKIMNIILKNNYSIFQSDLVIQSGFNKVTVSRLLDSLEAQGLVERRRRGMRNIVVLK